MEAEPTEFICLIQYPSRQEQQKQGNLPVQLRAGNAFYLQSPPASGPSEEVVAKNDSLRDARRQRSRTTSWGEEYTPRSGGSRRGRQLVYMTSTGPALSSMKSGDFASLDAIIRRAAAAADEEEAQVAVCLGKCPAKTNAPTVTLEFPRHAPST